MRNDLFRPRNIGERGMNSGAAVLDECHGMLRQMTLPLVPERRVKGALSIVARDSGLSYSKLRKIYYRLTDHILEFEFRNIAEAYIRHIKAHESKLEQELAELRALRDARAIRERQHAFSLGLSSPSRALASAENARADLAGARSGG